MLGELQQHGAVWGFELRDASRRPLSLITFKDIEQAREARKTLVKFLDTAVLSAPPGGRHVAAAASIPKTTDKRPRRGRQWTHMLLEEGQMDGIFGRLIEGFLVALIVANVAAAALETIPSLNMRFRSGFGAFEEFSLAIYVLEYIARLWCSVEDPRVAARGRFAGRFAYALRPLMAIDFLAFAPTLLGLFFGIDLRVLRIFRLFRLLKLARYSQALQALLGVLLAERSALLASGILLLAVTCLFGELMHLVEGRVQPNTFGTMPGAMYWAITTLTTVGYGDVTPSTPLGKVIAGITMVTGLALFALPVGIIANGFITGLNRRRFAITWNMLRRQPLFHGFDIDSLTDVLEVPAASVIREHAQVTVAGRDANELYLVIAGQARAEIAEALREFGPGDLIGEEALDYSETYSATVTAMTDMRVMAFPGDELRRLCRKYPILQTRIEQNRTAHASLIKKETDADRVKALEAEIARLQQALSALVVDRVVLQLSSGSTTGND